jgi:hypothetical protein
MQHGNIRLLRLCMLTGTKNRIDRYRWLNGEWISGWHGEGSLIGIISMD